MKTSNSSTLPDVAVIGGGPAGLMAAETLLSHGITVTLYDAMPSLGRKLLVAGKSGLNLTFDEPIEPFLSRYIGDAMPEPLWQKIITNFDNTALCQWAANLGIKTFTSRSGKVFPVPDAKGTIRAAPLLRRWIERLRQQGLTIKTRHRLIDIQPEVNLTFDHRGGKLQATHNAAILALGGASWPQTGCDGNWTAILAAHNIDIQPLTPANCGWHAEWPDPVLTECEGLPIKNITVTAGNTTAKGELTITRYGLEGAPIYRLGPILRRMPDPAIHIDFKPTFTHQQLSQRLGKISRNFVREAKRKLKLDPATAALLKHLPDRGPWTSVDQLVDEIKNCHVPLTRPRPITEAISSAGGVSWQSLDDNLMLKQLPGIHATGEMIDWEAPTGGYLLQASFATGKWAANAIASQQKHLTN